MKISLLIYIPLILSVSGCQRTDDMVRERLEYWKGQPMREYVEQKSNPPTLVFDNPDGTRTYIYQINSAYGGCGTTFKTVPHDREFIINSISTTCGPQQF
jgi:hypothetical protein